jgi:hypothetical protein
VEGQKSNGIAIDQMDAFKVESQCTAFLLQQGLQGVNVFPGKPPTDAQNYPTSNRLAVDFAGRWHCDYFVIRKPVATRNLMKKQGLESDRPGEVPVNPVNYANSTNSAIGKSVQ